MLPRLPSALRPRLEAPRIAATAGPTARRWRIRLPDRFGTAALTVPVWWLRISRVRIRSSETATDRCRPCTSPQSRRAAKNGIYGLMHSPRDLDVMLERQKNRCKLRLGEAEAAGIVIDQARHLGGMRCDGGMFDRKNVVDG